MSAKQNPFVWYDVMTTDTKAAEAFYAKVVGWDIKDSGMPDRYYGILFAGAAMVGGLMPIPEDARAMGAQPAWMGYIGVDDVDDYAKRVRAMGGAILRDCTDIPGVGRFAVAADSHQVKLARFRIVDAPVDPGDEQIAVWRRFDDREARCILHFVERARGRKSTFAVVHREANVGARFIALFAGNGPNDISTIIGAESYFGSVLFALDRFLDIVYPLCARPSLAVVRRCGQ